MGLKLNILGVWVTSVSMFAGVMLSHNEMLQPLQRRVIVALESTLFDPWQDAAANMEWASEFNGAFFPATPVSDSRVTVIAGAIPRNLSGVFLRVGPNVATFPPKKRTHVFDGDGMVHSVRIDNQQATYNAEYIQTPRHIFEQSEDGIAEWFPRLGEFYGWAGLMKLFTTFGPKARYAGIDNEKHTSTANTALGLMPGGGRGSFWALNEAGPPFKLHVNQKGQIESLGFENFLDTAPEDLQVSAHPKFDYATGETFFHGHDMKTKRFYVGRVFEGKLTDLVDLQNVSTGFHHDMFITQDFIVVIDGSLEFTPKQIAKRLPLWNFETDKMLRFGVIRRPQKADDRLSADQLRWIVADRSAEIVHTMFGYNEGGMIHLETPMMSYDPNASNASILGATSGGYMHHLVIDTAAKSVKFDLIHGDTTTEFPRVRDDRVGGRTRWGFSALQEGNGFDFRGIMKWDMLRHELAGTIHFGDGVVGGEPIFVPHGTADDEGFISMFLWNQKTKISTFVLYNAQTFDPEPVAELRIPHKVPLGFHGTWLSETDLGAQF